MENMNFEIDGERMLLILDIMDYIIDHEMEDFYDNPSRTHVFFKTVFVYGGKEEAEYHLLLAETGKPPKFGGDLLQNKENKENKEEKN